MSDHDTTYERGLWIRRIPAADWSKEAIGYALRDAAIAVLGDIGTDRAHELEFAFQAPVAPSAGHIACRQSLKGLAYDRSWSDGFPEQSRGT